MASPIAVSRGFGLIVAADLTLNTNLAVELILIDVSLEFEPVGVWAGE